ncbi:MAG: hypothetical protein ACYCWW_01225 [Deltaproteobacteria bacterium]
MSNLLLGPRWAAISVLALCAFGCGEVPPPLATGVVALSPGGGGVGGGGVAASGQGSGQMGAGSAPDAGVAVPPTSVPLASLPQGCLVCDPTSAENGGCPQDDTCASELVSGETAFFCADAYGRTGCPFCSPSNAQNGGCTDTELCLPFLVNGSTIYACQSSAGTQP